METRHRTVVEIKLDDKDIEEAGRTIARAFDPAVVEKLEKAFDRIGKSVDVLGKQFVRAEERLDKLSKRLEDQRGGRRGDGGGGGGFWQQTGAVAAGTMLANGVGRVGNAIGGMSGPTGASQALIGAIPGIGPAMAQVMGSVQTYFQEFLQQQTAVVRSMGVAGNFNVANIAGMGQQFGLDPSQAVSEYGQFSRTTGLRGDSSQSAAFRKNLQLSNLLGVNQAGSVVGAAGVGGQQMQGDAAKQLMLEAVSVGITSGIHITKLDEYLQNVSSWVSGVRTQGIDMNVESALGLVTGLSKLGPAFRGAAGVAAARSMGEGAAAAKDSGGMGSAMAYRVAEQMLRNRGANPNSFIEKRVLIEKEGRGKEFIGALIRMAKQMSGSNPAVFENIMQQAGLRVSTVQAVELAGASDARVDELSAGYAGTAGPAENELAKSERQIGGKFKELTGQARRAAARAEFGGRPTTVKSATDTLDRDLEISKTAIGFIDPITQKLLTAFGEGLKQFGTMLKDPIEHLANVIDSGIYLIEELGRTIRDGLGAGVNKTVDKLEVPRADENKAGIGGGALEPVIPPPAATKPAKPGPLTQHMPAHAGDAAEALRVAADAIDRMLRDSDRMVAG